MRSILFALALLISHCSTIFSDDSTLANQSPNVIAHSPPNTFVNDSVNVIDGNFCFSTTHLTVPGAVSLPLIQHYNNQSNYSSWLGTGMTLNYSFWMQGQSDSDKTHDKDDKYALMMAESSGGSIIRCIGRYKDFDGTNHYYLDPAIIHEGLTNCGSSEISGRTNLKNVYIKEKIKENRYSDWTSYLPDGTIKEYYRSFRKEARMNVLCETRPNRTQIDFDFHKGYSHQDEGSIKRITAKGTHELNWLRFDIDKKDATVSASNGKKVTFKYFNKDDQEYIEEIESSENPKMNFHYTKAGKYYCIDRIDWPHGRFLEVEYDHKGRVTSQKAPVGHEGEKRTIWKFSYDDHSTKVHDANDRKRVYTYKNKRLTALEQYDEDDELYRTQAYYWGKKEGLSWGKQPKTDEGNLLAEALLDKHDKAHYLHQFTYDDYGNVTKETLYGNLSSLEKKPFSVSENGEPKDSHVEHYSKRYTYSKDLHLKLSETEDDGPTIEYRYKKGTDLLWAKLTYDGSKIVKREFYNYDKDGVLIKKISDDGSTGNKKSLSGATQCLITQIDPVRNKEGHGNGLPKVVKESYLDLHSEKEILLRKIHYAYNKASQVTEQKVFNAKNKHCYTLTWDYDSMGRLKRRTNELGQIFTYNYDENSNKDYEKLHEAGYYTKYSYDKANRLIAEKQVHDDGTEVITTYEYDFMGNKTSSTDRYGNTTRYEYDACNRLKKITFPKVDDGTYTIKKEYDLLDNVTKETNQNGKTTTYLYNSRKQPCLITYPDGSQERFEYNLNGTLAHKWDRAGTKSSYTYDCFGRVLKTTIFDVSGTPLSTTTNSYNTFHLLSSTDAMGYTTYFSYDGAGRKIEEYKEADGNFSKTTFAYDALGRLFVTKAYSNKNESIATVFKHDLLNRLTREKKYAHDGALLASVSYKYDTQGNRTETKSAINNEEYSTTQALYNSQGELIQSIDPVGSITTFEYKHSFKNIHGNKSLKIKTTDALGNSTMEYFDALGRLISKEQLNSQNVLLSKTDYAYNGTGKKSKQTDKVIIDGQIERDYTVVWNYDSLDQVEKIIEQPGSPEEKVTSYKYDKAGRVIEITKPDGVTLNHVYDALGRLDHLTSSDGTVAYSYSYDLHNNPLYVRDEITQCIHKRTYDAWDRVTSDSTEGIFGFSYTYDPLGRLTALSAPDGSCVRYLYNQGHLSKIQRYDIAGTQRYEHSYTGFDLRGNVLESRLIGHTGTVRYSWDKKGRITKLDSAHFHQEIPPDGFDAVGNLKKCTFTDAIGEVVQEATYDDLYQLNEERGVKNHTYKNDSLNNRRQKDAKKYALDGLNKLLTDSEEQFTYDKNGNLVEIFSDKRKISLAYDALDRLIKVTNGQEVTSYQYDSLHRRIVKTSNQKTVHFLYFGQREIGLFDPTTSTITEFRVLGLGKGAELGASIALELNDALYCPLHDHRGNIVALVDPTTSKGKECYRYTAFGEREIYDEAGTSLSKSTLHNPWGFASKRHDDETGFVYFSRRYFAPEIGRWITADPAGFADGPNLYAYVHNNPLTRFDLYGLWDDADIETVHTNVLLYTAAEFTARGIVCGAGIGWELTNRSFGTRERMPIGHYFDQVSGPFEQFADNIRTSILEHANSIIGNDGPSAEMTYHVTNTAMTVGSLMAAGRQLVKTGAAKLKSYSSNGAENALTAVPSKTAKMNNLPGNQNSLHNPVIGKNQVDFLVGPNGTTVPTSRKIFESGLQKAGFETFQTESPGIGYIISDKLSVRIMKPSGPNPLRASFTSKPDGGHINPFTGKPEQPRPTLTRDQNRALNRESTHVELQP